MQSYTVGADWRNLRTEVVCSSLIDDGKVELASCFCLGRKYRRKPSSLSRREAANFDDLRLGGMSHDITSKRVHGDNTLYACRRSHGVRQHLHSEAADTRHNTIRRFCAKLVIASEAYDHDGQYQGCHEDTCTLREAALHLSGTTDALRLIPMSERSPGFRDSGILLDARAEAEYLDAFWYNVHEKCRP